MVPAIVPRQRSVLQAIWRTGRLSRRDLHEQTGIRPNTVGSDAAMLLKQGILRECTTRSLGTSFVNVANTAALSSLDPSLTTMIS